MASLRGIRAYLAEKGTALVTSSFLRRCGRARTAVGPDGAELRVSVLAEERDEVARTQTTLLRYERHHGADRSVVERPWVLHWYSRSGFQALAAAAGLTGTAVTDATEPQSPPARPT
ncbi:hypothetical protein GCM10009727_93010 [Actinomadura napierensis]|uniref:Uncharacterized protein n=1 Tax=Actinomadura napierensis TaxID=267854 RepID=A0ABP5M7P2_9ACTN